MGDESTALAPRSPAPKLEIADSLDDARVGQAVLIDAKGNVVTKPRRRGWIRAVWALAWASFGWTLFTEGLSLSLFTPIIAGLVLFLWVYTTSKPVGASYALLLANRDAEAEALFLSHQGRLRWSPVPSVRAEARRFLAMIAWRRGDHERALGLLDELIAVLRSRRSKTLTMIAWLSRFARARLLVIMGRGESVSLAELDDAPNGEFFVCLRRELILTMAFHAGSAASLPGDDTLHDWARTALGRSQYDCELAYLAWAFHVRGDDDMAGHLHREALDRLETSAEKQDVRLREWLEAWKPPG